MGDTAAGQGERPAFGAATTGRVRYDRRRRRRLGVDFESDGEISVRARVAVAVVAAAVLVAWAARLGPARSPAESSAPRSSGGAAGPDRDGATTERPSEPAHTCDGRPCVVVRVEGTLVDPGGDGLWIRDCNDASECDRRALAAEGQEIYAVCRVTDGMPVYGDTTWVRTPWHFTAGPIPAGQAARADATGWSDPASEESGWAAAHYLSPTAAIDALPLCT
ncbi:MAG TPA: hypothetical protein VFI47_04520 [Acidimicrobiales bacterium]|nr:hypothetical protein [Acidimicrobiales bacterium]